MLSSLRTKSGPKILSALLVSVLDHRQEHGLVTASSTFKPPPRVTLTDTKREAWLRDLGNSSVPLRRLSRTIPHGIRGKVLLDHCLGKDIPIPRALWLVKCVGANEIRAFKRKGNGGVFSVGGETKWVQDWTTHVQQFLEGLFSACGSSQWKDQVLYGFRLVSCIYEERLLDRGQYLDWLVRHLEQADLETLPLWLLLTRLHQQDLLASRQNSRRMAGAILEHLKDAHGPTKKAYSPLEQELVKEARSLMLSFPDSLLSPPAWNQHENIVREAVVAGDASLRKICDDISTRNRVLSDPAMRFAGGNHDSPNQRIVNLLDSATVDFDYAGIAKSCMNVSKDYNVLVKTCIRWATSPHRFGTFRTYAAVAILKVWRDHDAPLQECIYELMLSDSEAEGIGHTEFYRLVAELIVTKQFSVGKYCQWLLARGTYHKDGQVLRFETRLLQQIPLSGLPSHIQNLRRTLLSSVRCSNQAEDAQVRHHQRQIIQRIPMLAALHNELSFETLSIQEKELSSSCMTVRFEIASWLCNLLLGRQRSRSSRKVTEPMPDQPTIILSTEEFHVIRTIFEQLEVHSIFVDVLKGFCRTKDVALLVAVTDTVNYHFDVFSALDATTALFDLLYSQAKVLPSFKDSDRAFTYGLQDLAARLPLKKLEFRKLQKDVRALEIKQSAAAPSPISDTMIDAVQTGNSNFEDEMEQLLSNAVSIDEATLVRAFQSIVHRMQSSWDEQGASYERASELLARLRGFNPAYFDTLLSSWLDSLFVLSKRPKLSAILPPMICQRILTLDLVLHRSKEIISRHNNEAICVALDVLGLLTCMQDEHMPITGYRCYRFLGQRLLSLERNLDVILSVAFKCIEVSESVEDPLRSQANRLLSGKACRSFMRMVLAFVAIKNQTPSQITPSAQTAIKGIIRQECSYSTRKMDIRERVLLIINIVSSLNVTLCQLEIVGLQETTPDATELISVILSEFLVEKATTSPGPPIEAWSRLVSALPPSCATTIRERGEQAILSGLDSDMNINSTDLAPCVRNLLDLVSATSYSLANTDSGPFVQQVATKLVAAFSLTTLLRDEHKNREGNERKLVHFLSPILRLLVIHQSTIQNPRFDQEELAKICLSIAHLSDRIADASLPSLSNDVLDLLSLFCGSLTELSRSKCLRALEEGRRRPSPSISRTFGMYDPFDCKWLQISRSATTLAAGSASGVAGKGAGEEKPSTNSMAIGGKSINLEPYHLRRWEMVQDATPSVAENDACISLTLFGARKSVL